LTPVALLFLLRTIVIVCGYRTLSLLYFYNLFSYSAIQPQVCNKLSVQCVFSVDLIWLCLLDYSCEWNLLFCKSPVSSLMSDPVSREYIEAAYKRLTMFSEITRQANW